MKKKVLKTLTTVFFVALVMFVTQIYVVHAENVPAEKTTVLYSGVDGDLTWSIDADGHLSVTGNGDYKGSYTNVAGNNTYVPKWYEYRDEIKTAAFDISGMTNATNLLCMCKKLVSVDLSHFDSSNVTNMCLMFSFCSSLESIDVSNLDISKVTSMYGMFKYCSSLKNVKFGNFKTDIIKDMNSMFYACSSLESVDFSNVDAKNASNTNAMYGLVYGCTALKKFVAPKNVSDTIALPTANVWYDGNGNVCTEVKEGLDYSVTYTTYIVKYMKDATISPIADQTYNAKAITPEPVVTYKGKKLVKGTDYTVSYSNNMNPGTATVTVTGMGEYSGTKTATFAIKVKLAKSSVGSLEFDYIKGNLAKLTTKTYYNLYIDFVPVSYATTYEIKLLNNKGKKVKSVIVNTAGKDYIEKSFNNLTGSVYGVQIRAIRDGVYGAWSDKKYVLKQPRTQARSYQGNVQIKWEKINGATGYDIYMCASRNGKYKKIASAGKNVTLKTIKKFNKQKLKKRTYFYYVVAKKKVGGKTYKSGRNYVSTVINQ